MSTRLTRLAAVALVAAGAAALLRALRRDQVPLPTLARSPDTETWPPLPPTAEPATEPVPTAAESPPAESPPAESQPASPDTGPWAEPRDGACPDGYPIKAKLRSQIFHAPGQLNYERTVPDRCYASGAAAEADGLRAAKR